MRIGALSIVGGAPLPAVHYRRKQAQHNAPPKKRIHQATHSSVLAGWPASSVLVLMNGSGHLAASIGESGGCL